MKQYVVDAFADRVFEGNPAAVCLPETWPGGQQMLSIAREKPPAGDGLRRPEGGGLASAVVRPQR